MSNLSRKYRPQTFAEVYGQERVTQTLCREVERQKLGHAYLFSGPRGVGKTTAARIFAKAVNCLNPQKGEPCLKCSACERIATGQSIDIIEMDAASHTGVDNVREAIIEHVRFVPAALKFKVYIVDEAHMLTAQAWNALLKTIEEPPSYAVFIFATTEKHKVPATIVSRCQKFDFMRVSEQNIVERLKKIAKEENVKVDAEVLANIAVRSEGCLRDAENLLGQIMGLGEDHITADVASLVLPPSRLQQAAQLLTTVAARDTAQALKKIADLELDGVAILPLFDDLIQSVRKLMLAGVSVEDNMALKDGDEGMRTLATLVGSFDNQELVNFSLVLMERRKDAKQGLDARFALELALTSMTEGMTRGAHETQQAPLTAKKSVKNNKVDDDRPKSASSTFSKQEDVDTPKDKTNQLQEASTEEADHVEGDLACDLDQVLVKWQQFLAAFENNKSLLFILKLCKPMSVDGHKLLLRFQYPYHRQTIIGNIKNKQLVENALRQTLGIKTLVIDGVDEQANETVVGAAAPSTISRLIDAFGGQVAT